MHNARLSISSGFHITKMHYLYQDNNYTLATPQSDNNIPEINLNTVTQHYPLWTP